MKRFLVLLTFFCMSAPAQAHFVWLIPQPDGKIQIIFSDTLEPDPRVPITKIAQTEIFERTTGAVGNSQLLQREEKKDHYLLSYAMQGTKGLEVAGICRYGIYGKKGTPALINYYAKTSIGPSAPPGSNAQGWTRLPMEIVPIEHGKYRVLWQSRPITGVEVVAHGSGATQGHAIKVNDDGIFELNGITASNGVVGLRAQYVEKKSGEQNGKKYEKIRHFATLTFILEKDVKENKDGKEKIDPAAEPSDPAAVKLLAEARAARAAWTNFPGFSSDIEVNHNGKVSKGTLAVTPLGKVRLKIDADDDLKSWVNREINSLVSHRMPGSDFASPSIFTDKVEHHASGRAIRVLSDELHSSYRISGKQILEINRQMKDLRFTISVLENRLNEDKKYLPVYYVVNTWDLKTKNLLSSVAYHQTWTRIGDSDLPQSLHWVQAKMGQLDDRLLTFTNLKLEK